MEMSRQRLRPALSEGASIPCPRCGGSGHIRDTESSALQILRIIQEESLKDNTASVLCQVPVEVASFLLNEKRTEIAKIELKQRINVLMVPNKTLETPNYKLERLKHDDPRLDHIEASYKMAEEMEDPTSFTRRSQEPTNKQTPIIKGVLPDAPAPAATVKPESAKPSASHSRAQATAKTEPTGFFAWIKTLFASDASAQSNSAKPATQDASDSRGRNNRNGRDAGRDSGRNGRNGEGRGPRNEGRTESRPEGRSEGRPEGRNTRGGRGGRGGQGGERQNPNQRERFDADGKAVGANVDVSQDGVDGNVRQERSPRTDRGDRNGRQGRSSERNETGDRSDERNSDTSNVSANPEGNSSDREPREQRGRNGRNGNSRRNDRGPRQDDGPPPAQLDDSRNEPRDTAAPTETSDSREPRRSRDRYGRDRAQRGERSDRGDRNEPNASGASTMPERTSFESEESQEPIVVRASYFSQPAEAATAAPAESIVASAPVIVPAPSLATAPVVAAQTPAPATPAPSISAAPQGMPKVTTYALPTGALEAVAQGSGLQWVNSDPQRIAAVQAAIASEHTPAHVPRERAAPVATTEAPLVLVETKRDLRTVPLGSQE